VLLPSSTVRLSNDDFLPVKSLLYYFYFSVFFCVCFVVGDTVNEAIGNFLTNLVQYCHDYYQRELWQLDNRLMQLDHVDAVLRYATAGKSPAPLFLFKVVTAAQGLASA